MNAFPWSDAIIASVAVIVWILAHLHVRAANAAVGDIAKLLADLVAAGHGKAVDQAGAVLDDIRALVADFRQSQNAVPPPPPAKPAA